MAQIGDVTARLTADTAQFDAKFTASGKVADATSRAIEKASERARAAWQKELVAQDRAAEKAQAAARAKEMAALKADILARSLENEARAATTAAAAIEAAGHASVSQMTAASAAVRSFEGNPGIRAVERFLTTIPGVGAALQALFPVVGAVAFAGVVAGVIGKLKDLYDEVLTFKQLRADVDKGNLEGGDRIAELWSQTLSTMHGTGMRDNPLGTLRVDANDAEQALQSLQARARALDGDLGKLNAIKVGGNYFGHHTTEEENDLDIRGLSQNRAELDMRIKAKQAEIADLNSQITAAASKRDKRDETAANKAAEALRKASEARYKAMEVDLAQMKIQGNVTAKYEYDFWNARRNAFAQGSEQYLAVVRRQSELAVEGAKTAHELIAKYHESERQRSEWNVRASPEVERSIAEAQKRVTDAQIEASKVARVRADAADDLAVAKARADASLKEIAVNDAAGRTITRYDAAVKLAALHTQAYGVELDALNAKAQRIASAHDLTEPQKQEQLGKLAVDAENLQRNQAGTMMRDQAAMGRNSTSASVGAKDALNELADAARDSAKDLREMIGTTLRSLNEAIIDPKKGAFRQAGASIFHSAASIGLTKAEGYAASALPFLHGTGKPDGSASNPLHVIMAGLPGFQMPTSLTNSLTKIPDMSGPSLSGLGSAMLDLLPHFAAGGAVSAGTWAMVGERGPEPVYFGADAHVIPNHKMGSVMGGSGYGDLHVHVDARGAVSPAMVSAQARQAAIEGARHGRALAAQDQADRERRTLGGKRK